jgi:hypothetical protein
MELKIGDKVKITGNKHESNNEVGDIGIITEIDVFESGILGYKVTVDEQYNFGNWHPIDEIEIIKED